MKARTEKQKLDKFGNQVIQIPLYIAATSPFTLVTFDEGDEPAFTLEQANGRTYDRVKLCRTTTGLVSDSKLRAWQSGPCDAASI